MFDIIHFLKFGLSAPQSFKIIPHLLSVIFPVGCKESSLAGLLRPQIKDPQLGKNEEPIRFRLIKSTFFGSLFPSLLLCKLRTIPAKSATVRFARRTMRRNNATSGAKKSFEPRPFLLEKKNGNVNWPSAEENMGEDDLTAESAKRRGSRLRRNVGI
jgi:hypothetical protein